MIIILRKKIFGFFLSILLPVLLLAQTAPTLGTASNFVLFTNVGAITNTNNPRSQITGDVGSTSGAVTGFGNVNGIMQLSGNGATLQAGTDLNTGLAQINSATPALTIANALGAPGPGQTLNAGVYDIAGASALNGNLNLDGQNNPNAVFIIRINGDFSSGFGAKVIMQNQAQACNVFWRVNGMISLASATVMRGNLIANNFPIALNTADTLEGRAFAINGAITLQGVMAFTPTGCGVPLPAGPAALNLGTAGCFAVLSGNGNVTNTGTTNARGDVGTNVGITSGYDPLFVTGIVHPIPDVSTNQAKNDLLVVYNNINLYAPDIELLYPAEFGNDLVLTPHTYTLNAATALTGNVFLNAQGNTNAVFVIKIGGALTTSTLAKVKLVNGTQAKNVFWLVQGAASISGNSTINGSLIVNNGAIALAAGDSINGRILTTTGVINTASSVVLTPTGTCGSALPVSWLYFRGTPVKNNVLLEWGTANETNNKFFTLEKSRDGIKFDNLVNVDAAAGTGNTERNYSFTDKLPYALGYYRISQTDVDGRRSFYRTVQVKSDMKGEASVISFVQGNQIHVQTSGTAAGNGSLSLYSMEGRKILSQNIFLNKEGNTFKIQKPLQTGLYILKIDSGSEQIHSGKIVIY